ncbi:hypothetical protein QJS10_CPA06g00452 [Acorus calamus]|uniref:Uncharacterized protein n=1 Tax=Acorus calamus TaxID=4465 RepID=A0AAV9ENH9_ACOCL|nr:hypothetical protein QJS10_CPA06g00452 [Acorus calamus]
MEPTMMEFGHPWQAEGPPEAKNESFVDGFTELLLENSDEQNSSDSDNNCGGDVSEESKSYWNSIFNMAPQ